MVEINRTIDPEKNIAEISFSSPASFETVKYCIDFPKELHGKYILDIGGGASSATFELRKRGAIAYAVDYRYKDLKDLKRSVDKYLLGDSITRSMSADDKFYANAQRRSRNTFFETVDKTGYNYYIAALAGNLPFKDSMFDLCFSVQAVTRFLIQDYDVFIDSVKEGLRVLKPGGELQLQPWLGSRLAPWPIEWRKTATNLHTHLREKGIKYTIEETLPQASPRLRITK